MLYYIMIYYCFICSFYYTIISKQVQVLWGQIPIVL